MSVRVGTLRKRLLAGAALLGAALAAAPSVWAQQPDTTPRHHVVKRGDTLWDISHTYLGNPFLWPRVYDSNRRIIKDPHWIYPGQNLTIVPGPPPEAEAEPEPEPEPEAPAEAVRAAPEPEGRPLVDREEYLAAPWIALATGLAPVGQMLDRVKVEGGADRLPQAAMLQDEVYLRMSGRTLPAPGTEMLVVRVDRRVEPYGNIISPTGIVRVERGQGEVAVASIVKQYAPVVRGQRALALPVFTPLSTEPAQAVERGVEGTLIAFVSEQPVHTTADLGFVSIGKRQGLELGDELLAYAPTRPSREDPGVMLPPEDVARLRVVKLSDQTATVRVLSMRQAGLQPGLRVRLIARIP